MRAVEHEATVDGGTNKKCAADAVEAAPGGGEMIFLGPDRQYVIRARLAAERDLEVGCAREDASEPAANPDPTESLAPRRRDAE